MNILFVVVHYYPYIGGVEYVVKSLAECLVKMGYGVTVLAGEPQIDNPVEGDVNMVHVIRWPTWAPEGAYHIPKRRKLLERRLCDLLKNVDIVHAHSIHGVLPVWIARKVKKLNKRIRVIVTGHFHGTGHTLLRRLFWLGWRLEIDKLIEEVDKIHAVSLVEKRRLLKIFPKVAHKITVIPNGIDEDVFNYTWSGRDSNYMVYSGRIEKYKRLEWAVNLAKDMGLKLLIVGNGKHKRNIEGYARKIYPKGVEFLKPQPRYEYLKLVANSRYAVNPSKYEAFSIFTAEALAMGTPVIASREVAEALGAPILKPINRLYFIGTPRIWEWNKVIQAYLNKLYMQ